jgi:Hyaluronidase
MMNILRTIKSEGGNGVILWGSSSQFKTESQCRAFKSYLETDFFKVVQDVRKIRKV